MADSRHVNTQVKPPKKKRARRKTGPSVKADSKPALSSTTNTQSKAPTAASNPPEPSTAPLVPGLGNSTSNSSLARSNAKPQGLSTRHVEQTAPRSSVQPTTGTQTFVDTFFARPEYSRFRFTPYLPFIPQFDRMAHEFGWNEHSLLRAKAHEDLLDALVSQFNLYYGTNSNSLKSWQDLCRATGISPIPTTLEKARKAVTSTYVSVIDLIEHKRIGIQVPVFVNAYQLENYTKLTRKTFPSTHSKAGGVLQCLISLPATIAKLETKPPSPPVMTVSGSGSQPSSGSTSTWNPIFKNKSDSYIRRFFAQEQYSRYRYDPSQPIMTQYYKLRDLYGWEKGDSESDEAWEGIREALVLQFNSYFGENVHSLDSWMSLCLAIGLEPIPTTLEECREMVTNLQINIVDLLECCRTGETVTIFTTVEELSAYTMLTGRFFPSKHALAGGVLQALLRYIIDPSLNYTRKRSRKKVRTRRPRTD